ncbi:hypothetical protein V8C86DRAFT_2563976 [Haematococcus lacustris]|nr:hypothetical protein QJQ45_015263 [Haematococcus lacustris]
MQQAFRRCQRTPAVSRGSAVRACRPLSHSSVLLLLVTLRAPGLCYAAQQSSFSTMSVPQHPLNVLGTPLESCCTSPMTGFYRDGFCRTDMQDHGRHVVCAKVTQAFLEFSASRGNNLMRPSPPGFPGLKDGDKWCLCAMRWREALEEGLAPPVFLKATHAKALEYISLEELKKHAADLPAEL